MTKGGTGKQALDVSTQTRTRTSEMRTEPSAGKHAQLTTTPNAIHPYSRQPSAPIPFQPPAAPNINPFNPHSLTTRPTRRPAQTRNPSTTRTNWVPRPPGPSTTSLPLLLLRRRIETPLAAPLSTPGESNTLAPRPTLGSRLLPTYRRRSHGRNRVNGRGS